MTGAALTTGTVLAEHANEIRRLGKRVVADVVEIGRRLSECRTILKDDGGWRAWLENELKLSPQTAGRFIQVHELLSQGRSNLEHLNLPVSGLYLLAAPSTTEAARKEIAARAKKGEVVKHADVKKVIKKHRDPAKTTKPSNTVTDARGGKWKLRLKKCQEGYGWQAQPTVTDRTYGNMSGAACFKTRDLARADARRAIEGQIKLAEQRRGAEGNGADPATSAAGMKEQFGALEISPTAAATKDLEKQIAADRKYARNLVEQYREGAIWLRAVLASERRRGAVADALAGALKEKAA